MQVYLVVENYEGQKRVVSYSNGHQVFENLTDAENYCTTYQKIYGYLGAKFYVTKVNL